MSPADPTSGPHCSHCGASLAALVASLPGGRVSRQETCPKCSADLRTCLNCEFYDASRKWECREDISERVADKEKANFCEFFRISRISKGSAKGDPKSAALSAAEALFKKK